MRENKVIINPLISIVIPCYNGEKYLSQSIESCLNQTYNNIELIIVDDGSTDSTSEMLKSFEDPRIYIFHQKNKERSAARNLGIEKAKGSQN